MRTPTDQTALIPQQVISNEEASRLELLKKLLSQSWPLMLRGGVVAGRYFACSVLISKVDERLLAPNTLINALESIYIIFGGRSLSIVSSVISKYHGEQKHAEIGTALRHGLVLGFLVSLPITALYFFANHHILRLLGQHDFVVEKSSDYFQSAALGFLPLMLLTAQQRLLQGLHRPIPVLLSNTLHSGLSVLMTYLFLFQKFNNKPLEMRSVGYGFVIAGWVTLLLNTLYLFFSASLKQYDLFRFRDGFVLSDFKHIVKKGLPTGLQFTTENIANMINSLFLGLRNLTALSADQMAMQVALFLSIGNGGLAQAVSVCVGKSIGEKKYSVARKYGNMGTLIGISFPLLVFSAFLLLRDQFISLFIDRHNPANAELSQLASKFLLLECIRQLATAVQFTTSGALLGLQDTAFTMKTSVGFSLGLNALLLCLMHYVWNLNTTVLFASKAIGVGVAAFLNEGRWLLKGHEQSDVDKAVIQNLTCLQRVKRSMGLFDLTKPQQPPLTENDLLSNVENIL